MSMIFGVSGLNGAGKGEVIKYLEARSFYPFSLSDVIRERLAEQGVEETRDRMIREGNAIRSERGPGGLAEIVFDKMIADRNHVIDSIRHPAEVDVFRRRSERFQLIWVAATPETRLARLKARGRPGDAETLDELRAQEDRELGSSDPAAQQLLAVRDLADVTIENNSGIAELHEKLQTILEDSLFFERPSWDEYFMSIARVVSTRSNCVKRKVAAVITRDRRIISTGYNGTPRGVRNCNEGGCPRCNSFAEGGTRLDECLCSHGEENAITQVAYHGNSVRDATLYTTFSPCLICTKMIINSGIREVVYNAHYPMGDLPLGLLKEAGVKTRQVKLSTDQPSSLSAATARGNGISIP